MPGSVYHQLTATTPDDPAYEIRPSHFNQSHLVTINATGSEISNAFSNANGLSFGLSAGAITGSYTVPSVPSVTDYFSRTNTTFNGANISGSITNNTNGLQLSLSVAPGGGGADGYNIIAAGTQTGATTGTVLFNNANGISFGMANSSVVTASYTVPTQSNQTGGVYHVGNTTGQSSSSTYDLRTLSIDGAGIVSAGWSAGSLRISATQSNQAWSGSNASSTFQTLSFGNANGASWSNNAGAINLSYTVPTVTNSSWTVSDAATSLTIARLAFTNANGVTMTLSTTTGGSATVVASHNGLTSQSNQNVTAANGGFAFQTLSFSNLNGISFGTSAGSAITASHNALTTAAQSNHSHGNPQLNLTNLSGTTASNSAGFTLSLSAAAAGGVNPVASASNGSFSFTTLGFSNANNVTFGTSAGSIITASVAAPGAAAENNWVNLLGANTAGNTTASGSTIGYSGINLTLSGTNGSVVNISAPATSSLVGVNGITVTTNGSTISISGGGAAGGFTNSYFNPQDAYLQVTGNQGQGTLHIQPCKAPNVTFDRVCFPVFFSGASNSTNSGTATVLFGVYTNNNSTLSLSTSYSTTQGITHSGTASSTVNNGVRLLTMGVTDGHLLTEGQYWIGIMYRTTTGGGNHTNAQILASQMNSNFSGLLGVGTNATYQYTRGLGHYSASTTAVPNSIAFSEIRGSNSLVLRQPMFYFLSGTV